MDEVDFTILAATSVLGDLVEKCPPAEACRDAFDRMSKATVQMCMSTTGFSSSAQTLDSRRDELHSEGSRADYFDSKDKSSSTTFQRHSHGPGGRPKPTFDMGLNDLLGPVRTSRFKQGSQRGSGRVKNEYDSGFNNAPTQVTRQDANKSQAPAMNSPSKYTASPPLSSLDPSSAAMDPSHLPSHSHSPPSTFSNPSSNQTPFTQPQPPFYQEQQFSFSDNGLFTGMDFLQGNGWEANDGGGGVVTGGNGGFNGGDFGMGLGWEGVDHDFSDGGGQLPDLFEGFFFGGAGNF